MNAEKKSFYFDELALQWNDQALTVERAEKVYAWMREHIHLHRGMKCLELGAATGRTGFLIEPHVAHVHLLDGSPSMTQQAQERITRSGLTTITASTIDLDSEALPPGPWDLIYSAMTLHHVVNIRNLFKKISEIQRAGAWVSLVDLFPEDGSFHGQSKDHPAHNGFDPPWLEGLLTEFGYGNFRTDTIYSMKKPGLDGLVRSYPLFMLSGQRLA